MGQRFSNVMHFNLEHSLNLLKYRKEFVTWRMGYGTPRDTEEYQVVFTCVGSADQFRRFLGDGNLCLNTHYEWFISVDINDSVFAL